MLVVSALQVSIDSYADNCPDPLQGQCVELCNKNEPDGWAAQWECERDPQHSTQTVLLWSLFRMPLCYREDYSQAMFCLHCDVTSNPPTTFCAPCVEKIQSGFRMSPSQVVTRRGLERNPVRGICLQHTHPKSPSIWSVQSLPLPAAASRRPSHHSRPLEFGVLQHW